MRFPLMMVYIIIVSGNYCYMLVRIEKERINLLKIRIIYFYNFALSFQLKKIKNMVILLFFLIQKHKLYFLV
jgi:hypothetical protein